MKYANEERILRIKEIHTVAYANHVVTIYEEGKYTSPLAGFVQ